MENGNEGGIELDLSLVIIILFYIEFGKGYRKL